MSEMRRVRFANIDGIERADLPLANEIWMQDVHTASWATRDAMQLACQLARYMAHPDQASLSFRQLEAACRLKAEDVHRGLQTLEMFGAVIRYAFDDDKVSVVLHLSLLQRLRVLETKQRFLSALSSGADIPWAPPSGMVRVDAAA